MPTNMFHYAGQKSPIPLPEMPTILDIQPLTNSQYIQPKQVRFQEKGSIKTWDIVNVHDGVAILLYDKERDGFIFVRQFRISVFLKDKNHGYMYELCAGLCDKDISPEETALEELQEECGYHIPKERLFKIHQFYSGVGMNGAKQYLFYAIVSDADKKSSGGGNESEQEHIDIVFVPRSLIDSFLQDRRCPVTQSLAYALTWFLLTKPDEKK